MRNGSTGRPRRRSVSWSTSRSRTRRTPATSYTCSTTSTSGIVKEKAHLKFHTHVRQLQVTEGHLDQMVLWGTIGAQRVEIGAKRVKCYYGRKIESIEVSRFEPKKNDTMDWNENKRPMQHHKLFLCHNLLVSKWLILKIKLTICPLPPPHPSQLPPPTF